MRKFGHYLWIAGIPIAVVGLIFVFSPWNTGLFDILLFGGFIIFAIGLTISQTAPYPKAVRNGPLVRATVIDKQGRGYENGSSVSRFLLRFTTEDGQEITGKITNGFLWQNIGDNDVPVRYNPLKPTEFMIDQDAFENATFFKEDLDKQNPFFNINSSNVHVSRFKEQPQARAGTKPAPHLSKIRFWIIIPVVLFLGVTGSALYFTFIRPNNQLNNARKNWTLAPAVIVSSGQTNNWVNNNPQIKFTLDYTANGKKYENSAMAIIQQVHLSQVQPGNYIPVWYNPKDPNQIVIDINITDAQRQQLNNELDSSQ